MDKDYILNCKHNSRKIRYGSNEAIEGRYQCQECGAYTLEDGNLTKWQLDQLNGYAKDELLMKEIDKYVQTYNEGRKYNDSVSISEARANLLIYIHNNV